MTRSIILMQLGGIAAALLLAGCAGTMPDSAKPETPAAPAPAPVAAVPAAPVKSPAQLALEEGIALYNNGSFADAIKRLGSSDIAGGDKALQVNAHKYLAFSYCVTGRQTLCRQQFDKAFKLDPAFDLAQGEHGHPLWSPAFLRAKKAK